jgi:chromosome segregation ATPase
MPSGLDRFRERQEGFDARLTTVEETVQTGSRLRAAMDRDISDIKVEQRAQRGLLQALADTQSEHTARLSQHTAVLDQHTATLNQHTAVLDEHTAILNEHSALLREHGEKLGMVHAGVLAILARLDAMDGSRLGKRIGRLLRARRPRQA